MRVAFGVPPAVAVVRGVVVADDGRVRRVLERRALDAGVALDVAGAEDRGVAAVEDVDVGAVPLRPGERGVRADDGRGGDRVEGGLQVGSAHPGELVHEVRHAARRHVHLAAGDRLHEPARVGAGDVAGAHQVCDGGLDPGTVVRLVLRAPGERVPCGLPATWAAALAGHVGGGARAHLDVGDGVLAHVAGPGHAAPASRAAFGFRPEEHLDVGFGHVAAVPGMARLAAGPAPRFLARIGYALPVGLRRRRQRRVLRAPREPGVQVLDQRVLARELRLQLGVALLERPVLLQQAPVARGHPLASRLRRPGARPLVAEFALELPDPRFERLALRARRPQLAAQPRRPGALRFQLGPQRRDGGVALRDDVLEAADLELGGGVPE